MNKFEQKAYDLKIKKLASWEHNIETYTKGKTDWVMIIATATMILFGIAMLIIIL